MFRFKNFVGGALLLLFGLVAPEIALGEIIDLGNGYYKAVLHAIPPDTGKADYSGSV